MERATLLAHLVALLGTLRQGAPKPRRQQPSNTAVVQQQKSQRQHQVIQKRVVGRDNYADLPRCDNAKANEPRSPRQKHHPDHGQLHAQRACHCGRMKPVRQMLDIPPDPRGQRPVLVVLIHRRKIAPFRIAAEQFHQSGFKVDAEPLPLQQKEAGARGWAGQPPAGQHAAGRKEQRQKPGFKQHAVRLIAGKHLRRGHEGKKAEEADEKTEPRPQIEECRD